MVRNDEFSRIKVGVTLGRWAEKYDLEKPPTDDDPNAAQWRMYMKGVKPDTITKYSKAIKEFCHSAHDEGVALDFNDVSIEKRFLQEEMERRAKRGQNPANLVHEARDGRSWLAHAPEMATFMKGLLRGSTFCPGEASRSPEAATA